MLRFAPPDVLTPAELLHLQRQYGNTAVLQLVGQRMEQVEQHQPIDRRAPVEVLVEDREGPGNGPLASNPDIQPSSSTPASHDDDAYYQNVTPVTPASHDEDAYYQNVTPVTPASHDEDAYYQNVTPVTPASHDEDAYYQNVTPVTPASHDDDAYYYSSSIPVTSSQTLSGSRPAARPPRPLPVPPLDTRPLKTDQGYKKLLDRQARYAREFEEGTVDIPVIVKNFEKAVAEGTLDSVATGMKRAFGWSAEDCTRYLPKANLSGEETGVQGPATAQGRLPKAVDDRPLVHEVGETERSQYELHGGSPLTLGPAHDLFDTSQAFSKWMGTGFAIFVMDSGGQLFSAQHKVGLFHHSSFLAGGSVAGAGELQAKDGMLQAISNKSGHYQPGAKEAIQVLDELRERGIDLSTVTFYYFTRSTSGKPPPWPGGAVDFYRNFKLRPDLAPK